MHCRDMRCRDMCGWGAHLGVRSPTTPWKDQNANVFGVKVLGGSRKLLFRVRGNLGNENLRKLSRRLPRPHSWSRLGS